MITNPGGTDGPGFQLFGREANTVYQCSKGARIEILDSNAIITQIGPKEDFAVASQCWETVKLLTP